MSETIFRFSKEHSGNSTQVHQNHYEKASNLIENASIPLNEGAAKAHLCLERIQKMHTFLNEIVAECQNTSNANAMQACAKFEELRYSRERALQGVVVQGLNPPTKS